MTLYLQAEGGASVDRVLFLHLAERTLPFALDPNREIPGFGPLTFDRRRVP
jgi:hypothetical protein